MRPQVGGVERVARELCARLPALRPDRYTVHAPRPRFAHRAGHLWEQAVLPLATSRARLVLSPANLAPLACGRRNLVLIHDLAALRHPEAYGGLYAQYQRRLLPALARRAARVITVSEFSRRELVELLGIPPAQVEVVPNGVDDRFSPGADPGPAGRRYGLERPYVLAVGSPSARKNLGALDLAARRLRERGAELVLAGSGRGYLRGDDLPAAARALGYVDEDLLPGLYAGALALVMPSLHEGFGLPCLEAMASGVPVVAARRGALPETCGNAAMLVEPEPETISGALVGLLDADALRERLRAAGRERAAGFSWDRSAQLMDGVVGRALSPG